MGKIHCIHCNQINDDNEMFCSNCHKSLYELDKYYTDMLKDHLTGKVKDSVTSFLLQLIKENLYGIIMTITVISTVIVNVAVRSDNAEVVSKIDESSQVIVHNDGIKSSTQYEALKVLGKAYYEKDFDLLNKSSYLYNFGNKYSSEIKKLTNYGTTLEEITEKHKGKYIYLQFEYYNEQRYKEKYDKYIDTFNHALYPLINETEYASTKVNIPNIDLDKIKNNDNIIQLNDSSSNGKQEITLSPTTVEGTTTKQVVLTKEKKNIFGKKLYKIDVSNEYGYEAQIYISFLPENREDPTVHSSSTLNTITEGQYFDIGAVYTQLTLTASQKKGPDGNIISGQYENWDFKAVETKASDVGGNGVDRYINIAGIDAWTYTAGDVIDSYIGESGLTINKNETQFPTIEDKYLDPDKMLLQYVKIQKIEYLYGENKVPVGETTVPTSGKKDRLASVSGSGLLIKAEKQEEDKLKLTKRDNDTTRGMGNEIFSVPHLADWVYSDYATSKNSTDLVPITMRITLEYKKGNRGSSDYQNETYSLTHDITV